MPPRRVGAPVLGVFVDALRFDQALEKVALWAARRDSRYVCFCNAHVVVSLGREGCPPGSPLAAADLALPDGAPVAWMLRQSGFAGQERLGGPDFMWQYCALAEQRGESVFFYGSTPETLEALQLRLIEAFPRLKIADAVSPPFRPLTQAEDEEVVDYINATGAGVVFVGLGCPKQEAWMAAHRGRIQAVMLGVGAAFDYHAGTLKRAPEWMRRNGLEWLHRLASEPGRLWRRYLLTNTLFVLGAGRQLLGRRLLPGRPAQEERAP